MTSAGFIRIGNKAILDLYSFFSVILWYEFFSCIIALQDIFSSFRCIFRTLSSLTSYSRNAICNNSFNTDDDHHVDDVTPSGVCHQIAILGREDVEMVTEKLGLSVDYKSQLQGVIEMAGMFDEIEPSLEEVREAFNVFDENHDGYIDAYDLKRVTNVISLTEYSESECKRMILAFDENGDGRIDFSEFVKLMENALAE